MSTFAAKSMHNANLKCIVAGCRYATGTTTPKCLISFHEFPTNIVHRQQWESAIEAYTHQPVRANLSSRICSEHFYPTDISMQSGKLSIRQSAVPKLFPLDRLRTIAPPPSTSISCKPIATMKTTVSGNSIANSSAKKPLHIYLETNSEPVDETKSLHPISNVPISYTAVVGGKVISFKVVRITSDEPQINVNREDTAVADPLQLNDCMHENDDIKIEPDTDPIAISDSDGYESHTSENRAAHSQPTACLEQPDAANTWNLTLRYPGDVPNDCHPNLLDKAVIICKNKIRHQLTVIRQLRTSNSEHKLEIEKLKMQTKEIRAKIKENEKRRLALAKCKQVAVADLIPNCVTSLPCTQVGCDQIFTNNGHLQLHLTKHHKIVVEKHKQTFCCPAEGCKYSKKTWRFFPSRKALRQHYAKVHAPKVESCSACNNSFASVAMLLAHKRSCGQTFKCFECSCTYASREALQTHCRRKGHIMPKPVAAPLHPTVHIKSISMPAPSSMPKRKFVKIAPKSSPPIEMIQSTTTTTTDDRKKQLQTSQTQTKLFLDKWNERVVPSSTATSEKNVVSTTFTQPAAAFADLDFFDTETTTNMLASSSSQTDRNLNTHNFMGADSLGYFDNFAHGFCDIETQTELLPSAVDQLDQLLYNNMHTQTCDEIMSEFGWTDIQTQTNFPLSSDYNTDLLVSTETQTSFTACLQLKPSAHTQTLGDLGLNAVDFDCSSNSNFSTRYTQTMLDKCL